MNDTAPSAILLEYTQDKIAVLDESGAYTYVNAAAERILGFDPDTLVGQNVFEYIHPEDCAEVQAQFESIVRTDEAFLADTATYRHRASDGSWVWLESRMSNLTDSELSGYVVSSRVVTDRVEAERDRRETRERLQELADTTDDVLWMFDGDWSELLFCNPAYEDVFGRPIEELESDPQSFLEAVYPPDRQVAEEAMERLSNGVQTDLVMRVNPSTDYNRWLWVQGEPIVRDGEVVRIAGFSRDVTDRRRRERQLLVIDNFLRHNVRNQLNVVIGNAAALEADLDGEREDRTAMIRRAGETLLETAEKQRDIVNVLTTMPQSTTTDVAATVRDAVAPLRDQYSDATIDTAASESVIVEGPGELSIAVAELVENGIRHARSDRPTVTVSVRTTADDVELSVTDEAPPIPEYDRRVLLGDHEMTAVNHSRGCGLWLVYWIVDLAGGSIDHTADESGNTVTISLRRAL
ncbi:PAS domain-containing sensor histidine kinase [Halomicroarcula sp. S1AR25-4]|uniref:PAS domain-containing sensor histidine kinase n=1 Tax=Haloarcula sp. S1AR25-4 TaxID=2950538 RepID=UPI00287529EB|nr:PAS domain-containing sensor histidine kinase [Halomicroarcula sp. S1AR25-4]MDS0279108.1 PAS domain-containing sensor histidine kinase [Halomicroarcula sp. S1AR25-4]